MSSNVDLDLSPLEDGMDRYLHLIESSNAESYIYGQIEQALSHHRVYNGFADLLASKSVQKLLKDQDQGGDGDSSKPLAMKHTLELFAFGTMDDYVIKFGTNDRSYYMELSDKQLDKLRRLTVVSLVKKLSLDHALSHDIGGTTNSTKDANQASEFRNSTISYSALLRHLHLNFSTESGPMTTTTTTTATTNKSEQYRALEELLTDCIYNKLLVGGHHKLNQKQKCLHVLPHPSVVEVGVTRDVDIEGGDLVRMSNQLKYLVEHCDSVVKMIQGIASSSEEQRERQDLLWASVKMTMEEEERNSATKPSPGRMGRNIPLESQMGVDGRSRGDSRRSKRRHPGAFLGMGGSGHSRID